MPHFLVRALNALLKPVGYTTSSRTRLDRLQPRPSLRGALRQLRAVGLQPSVVLDVGAAEGTPDLQAIFSDVPQILFEPLREYHPMLTALKARHPRIDSVMAAVGSEAGSLTINVYPELDSTSLYSEPGVQTIPREIPVVTLDDICRERGLTGPFLIKADVEGAELDVMRGAAAILPETACVILETTLFRFRDNAPQIDAVIRFMIERGFAIYDIVGAAYRPLDGALARLDVVFVPDDSPLRAEHRYASDEQRAARVQKFQDRDLIPDEGG